METIYNNTFLNSLFTSNEFDFIEHISSDIKHFDNMIEIQLKLRDVIVKLINSLNDSIYFSGINHENSDEEQSLLKDAKDYFELINTNITILQSNKELSDNLNKKMVDLLIKIDSEGENVSEKDYIDEISQLKNEISELNIKSEKTKTKVINNDRTIYEFFNESKVKKYLNAFSINFDVEPFIERFADPVKNLTNEHIPTHDYLAEDITIDAKQISEDTSTSTDEKFEKDINPDSEKIKESFFSDDIKEDSNILLISEKRKKVYLPYSKSEVLEYLNQFPNEYVSFEDVIKREFIFPSDFYLKHPVIARFREAYSLIRDREAKSILDAFKFSIDLMFKYDLNPAIVAACKTQEQLEHYIDCLAKNKPEDFKDFIIKFEVTPLKM